MSAVQRGEKYYLQGAIAGSVGRFYRVISSICLCRIFNKPLKSESMKVKIVQRKNPQKPDEPGKFYGQPVLDGVVGMDMICRQIAGVRRLRPGCKNVLTNFLDGCLLIC